MNVRSTFGVLNSSRASEVQLSALLDGLGYGEGCSLA